MTTRTVDFGTRLSALLALLLLALCVPARSIAGAEDTPSLDILRKSGTIGERYDGFVVLRTTTSDANIRKEIDAVNAKRAAIYEASAKKQSVPALEVGKVYALQIVAKSPPGTWFLGEDGAWKQKK
jgi:uncharacterized protein YdbL (DUF1318 family)